MEPASPAESQRLSAFIRGDLEAILKEWEGFARTIFTGRATSVQVLRDHAAGMLLTIADEMDEAQSASEQNEKSQGRAPRTNLETEAERHGSARVASGFSIDEAISEFRALRASVLRLWSKSNGSGTCVSGDETVRFNEAIDQAIAESMRRYSLDKDEHTRRFDTLLSASPDLKFILDLDACFLYANLALSKLFQRDPDHITGRSIDVLCSELAPVVKANIAKACSSHAPVTGEFFCQANPKVPVAYRYVFLPVLDADGEVDSISGSARNISELKASEEQILRHAYYDSLTGLPNRALFRDRLDQELRHSARTGRRLALLYLDLDGFKEVNDRYGHPEGDLLLQEAGRRLESCVRASDTVARLGGDEFTVILTDFLRYTHIEVLAREILAELARPFRIQGKELRISCSIGITVYPHDATSPDELIRNADQAMFVAKKAGRNRYNFFTEEMRDLASARLKTIDELRQALVSGQLSVYYQPIIDMRTGAIVKAEALVRWHHPDYGLLLPSEFIALAEETGLIGEIGMAVVDEVVARVQRWSAMLGTPFQISVNKSPVEFMDRARMVPGERELELLRSGGSQITVEITEGVMLNDSPAVRDKLRALRQAGVQLAIDDFGIGYSSMASLKNFKVDFLKIDQSFVKDIMDNLESRVFAETIVVMAHKLGLKVIAEGVETQAQHDWLLDAGCDYAQGFLFSEATDADHFEQMLGPFPAPGSGPGSGVPSWLA